MPKIIIADTSCFIILTNINELNILKEMYGQVITTPEVALEYKQPLPDWVLTKPATDNYRKQILEIQIDKGEASAIALAIETPGSTLILDDYKARKVAVRLGLNITGTIGVIVKAKLSGLIPSIKPFLLKIRTTDFHLSEAIELQALTEAGE